MAGLPNKCDMLVSLDLYESLRTFTVEQKAHFLDAMFLYCLHDKETENEHLQDPAVRLMFNVFRSKLDRDSAAWEEQRIRRTQGQRERREREREDRLRLSGASTKKY